jgi:hypothetical protein
MAVIPSRLAGVPAAFNQWMNWRDEASNNSRAAASERRAMQRHNAWMQDRNRISPGEIRSQEKHKAWKQGVAGAMAQETADKQRQAAAIALFHKNPNNLAIKGGAENIDVDIRNPEYDAWGAEGEDPPVDPMVMNEMIQKSRAVTPTERFNVERLYSDAYDTKMPGGSALARLLGAGAEPDPADKPFTETRWNASQSEGGVPFGMKQRQAYQGNLQETIAAAVAESQKAPEGGMAGSFKSEHNVDDVRQVIMQDVWTVARKIARDTELIDEGTAFHQILDAMARGKISPIQISQLTGDDAVLGDEGFNFTTNTRGLQASATPRETLRKMYENEYGKISNAETANLNSLPPPN